MDLCILYLVAVPLQIFLPAFFFLEVIFSSPSSLCHSVRLHVNLGLSTGIQEKTSEAHVQYKLSVVRLTETFALQMQYLDESKPYWLEIECFSVLLLNFDSILAERFMFYSQGGEALHGTLEWEELDLGPCSAPFS